MSACFVASLKSAKKHEKELEYAELLTTIKKTAEGYEIIKERMPVVPYYDYDFNYDTEKQQKNNYDSDLKIVFNDIYKVFKNPKIILFISNGFNGKLWKNSFHIIVRGCGFYTTNAEIPLLENCDKSVYSKYQKFRLPFCSKVKEKRYKNLLFEGKIYDINNFEKTGLKFEELLPTYTGDEVILRYAGDEDEDEDEDDEDAEDADDAEGDADDAEGDADDADENDADDAECDAEGDADDAADDADDAAEDDGKLRKTVKDFKNLLSLISIKRIEEYKTWLNLMRICKNIYNSFNDGDKIEARNTIHNTMKRDTRPDKYKSCEIDNFLDRTDDKPNTISWGSLVRYAKIDNIRGYKELRNPKKSGIFDIELIERLQKMPKKYYWKDNRKFNNKTFENAEEILKYLVDTSFKINNGGKTLYITKDQVIDGIKHGRPVYSYTMKTLGINPFNTIKDAVVFKIKNKKYELHKFSEEYFKKYSYDYQQMLPFKGAEDPYLNVDDRIYNKFEAFEMAVYKQQKPGTYEKMLYHIKNIICNNEAVVYEYVLSWIGYLIQHPDKKHETCLLLQSLEGAGKNMFIEIMRSLLGVQYVYDTGNIEEIIGNFNSHLSGKLLVVGDELIGYAGFKKSDFIKCMMTAPNISITKKGVDTIKETSYHRYIFTTNNIETLKISNEDRRICVLGVSNEKIKNYEYFKELKAEMDDMDNVKALFDYFNNLDLSNFDFRKAPLTDLKKEMIVQQLDDIYDWFIEYVDENMILKDKIIINLTYAYENYCESNNSKIRRKDFKNKLCRLIPCEFKRITGGMCFQFELDKTRDYLMKLMNLTDDPFSKSE